jgi:hypothetical protein
MQADARHGFRYYARPTFLQYRSRQDMARTDRILGSFLPALYPVAALLVIAPLTEMFGAAGSVRPGLASWRFGVVGVGLNAVVVHVLGFALALGVAAYLNHRRAIRAISVAALVAAVVVVAGIARFLLDFNQVQALVPATDRPALDAATLRALILASLAVPVLVTLGGKGWTASGLVSPEPETPAARVIPFPGRTRLPDPRWPR